VRTVVKRRFARAISPAPRRRAKSSRRAGARFGIIGEERSVLSVYAVLERVASMPTTVLITGESGTGQEAHRQSSARELGSQGETLHQGELRRDPEGP